MNCGIDGASSSIFIMDDWTAQGFETGLPAQVQSHLLWLVLVLSDGTLAYIYIYMHATELLIYIYILI